MAHIDSLKDGRDEIHINCNFSYDPTEFLHILADNKSLRKLEIYNIELNAKVVDSFALALERNATLKHLTLKSFSFDNDCGQSILSLAEAFRTNTGVFSLNLQNLQNLDEVSPQFCILAEALQFNESIEILKLKNITWPKDVRLAFASSLLGNTSIYNFDIESSPLGNLVGGRIGEVLKTNNTLALLSLYDCQLGDEAAVIIADTLRVNRFLVLLNLSANRIGRKGGSELAKALSANSTLEEIGLDFNEIGDSTALLLAKALKENTSLLALKLVHSGLTDKGIVALFESLTVNRTLRVLALLPENYPGLRGPLAERVVNAITHNNVVLRVDIFCVDTAFEMEITQALGANAERYGLVNSKENVRFEEILRGNRKAPWNRARLMFVGQGKAGKTATVRSLLGKKFDPAWISTVGANISESITGGGGGSRWKKLNKESKFATGLAAKVMAGRMKKPDHQRDRKTAPSMRKRLSRYFRGFTQSSPESSDTNDLDSTAMQNTERETLDYQISNNVGSDPLSEEPKVNTIEKVTLKEMDYAYHERLITDARRDAESISLSLWDFGGQTVFYSMHHIYLTKFGVYVVIFDLRELVSSDTREKSLEYLRFWLNSIQLHSPSASVFLAGTFAAECKSSMISSANDILTRLIDVSEPFVTKNRNESLVYFPIDNKTEMGIAQLRSSIEMAIETDPSVSQEVSIRWMVLLDKLMAHRSKNPYMTLSDVFGFCNELRITDEREQNECLNLFHERGNIIHLTATQALNEIVVVEPQWLIEMLGLLIRDSSIHVTEERFEKVGLADDFQSTFQTGITTRDYLDFIWTNQPVEFLLDLMKRTLLLSDWSFTMDKEQYLVPSLLKMRQEPKPKGIKFTFDFSHSFLPRGVFQRLVCLCVAGAAKQPNSLSLCEPELFENYAFIEIEKNFCLHLLKCTHTIEIFVEDDSFASRGLRILISMLRKLNYDVMGTGLKWQVNLYDREREDLVSYNMARERKLKPWFGDYSSVEDKPGMSKHTDLESFLSSMS